MIFGKKARSGGINLPLKIAKVFTFLLAMALLSPLVTANDGLTAKITTLQETLTPLQASGARILQVYEDYYAVSDISETSPVSEAIAQMVTGEATEFFTLYNTLIASAIVQQGAASNSRCKAALEKLDSNLVAPLKQSTKNIPTVRSGYANSYATSFLAVSSALANTLMSGECL